MTPAIKVLAKTLLKEMVHFKDTMESEMRIDVSIVRHITEMLNTFKETFEKDLFCDEEILRYIDCFLDFLSFTLQGSAHCIV